MLIPRVKTSQLLKDAFPNNFLTSCIINFSPLYQISPISRETCLFIIIKKKILGLISSSYLFHFSVSLYIIILERVVFTQSFQFFPFHFHLKPFQLYFKLHRSTETAIVNVHIINKMSLLRTHLTWSIIWHSIVWLSRWLSPSRVSLWKTILSRSSFYLIGCSLD